MELHPSPGLTAAAPPVEQAPVPTPPIRRGPMVPRPWSGLGLHRLRRTGAPTRPDAGAPVPWGIRLRRFALLLLVLAPTVLGVRFMLDVLPQHGGTALEMATLVVFAILFAWISAGFWTGVMGFLVLASGRDRHRISRQDAAPGPIDPAARTAVIMPICNEDVATVFAGLRATIDSLLRTGEGRHFDFFVLSDTGQPDIRVAEQAAWRDLVDELGGRARVFYRWRQRRTKRKAGNVADFCRRWGRLYRYMVVLDADSVMTGSCLTTLVRLMERHPQAGIIQTAPIAVGHDTVHARAQQFAARLYGPLFTAGMHAWQLGESHYWGHNAILRVAPFMAHAGLAALPGRGSLSGEIMSHDFVEAALMRRAGYQVWIAYDLPGSYEQFPPNLLAEVGRDRRWCHGNLQNARLMFEPGMHPVHRAVFLTGLLAYLSAPLWLLFLLLSTVLVVQHTRADPQYFVEPHQLFPLWPQADLGLMITLFGLTAALLLVPKALALALVLLQGQARRYGGPVRLLVSALLEFWHSVLLAPVRMMFHTQFVLAAATGWLKGWQSPPRDDAATTWRQAWSHHGAQTLLGITWLCAVVVLAGAFPWWLSPVLAGLMLSVPLSVWTSRSAPGGWMRRMGLLVIPEERRMPWPLRQARMRIRAAAAPLGFAEAMRDPELGARVASAVPVRAVLSGARAAVAQGLLGRALEDGPHALGVAERMRLLQHPALVRALASAVTSGAAHPGWREAGSVPASVNRPAPTRPGLSLGPAT